MPYEITGITAPSTVESGEEFEFEIDVCCEDPQHRGGSNCATSDAIITIGGETVFQDTFAMLEGCAGVPFGSANFQTIDEPGTYTILMTVGAASASQDIEVVPASNGGNGDNGNGGNGNGNGGGDGDRSDLLRTAVVAGVGAIGGLTAWGFG